MLAFYFAKNPFKILSKWKNFEFKKFNNIYKYKEKVAYFEGFVNFL